MTPPELVQKWSASGAAESANAQSFTNDLCALLGVERPQPSLPDDSQNTYVFEKRVTGRNGNTKFIDCYKRGHFILENKQGASLESGGKQPLSQEHRTRARAQKTGHGTRGSQTYDTAMLRAKNQAENYARLLDGPELQGGRPPFLLVCDVGHSISVYADWSRAGGHYQPFPDPSSYRIALTELHRDELRQRLRLIWTDPLRLDPARRSARVTKEIADSLARLAKSLEETGETAEQIAGFLMRCLFTMFAEDVGLLDQNAFTKLLRGCVDKPHSFQPKVAELWQKMNSGGYSLVLDARLRRFNGGFFADTMALDLNADQIQLLLEAARADWTEVEPAIFGTLLERALSPRDRHKLGAHYTPRAYVERLVQPTVLDPLRAEWESVQTAALSERESGNDAEARRLVSAFVQRLADVRVLDPACGSGNFLYVTLELLKRLEGEVRNVLRDLGEQQVSMGIAGATVTPANMLGIELNPRAAAIAELVLWIGYLRWQIRTTGSTDLGEPLLRDYHNIENRDAVLAYTGTEPLLDGAGEPVTRWDGVTYKIHPVTGLEVPDEGARSQVLRYVEPRAAEWPAADFIVGNPPFLGKGEKMRMALGDGYMEAIQVSYKDIAASADFVMYWWYKAAKLLQAGEVSQFGFITTNSISQTFNRRVIEGFLISKDPISIVYAIADHPWVDSADGAAVRIAMTVAGAQNEGRLEKVIEESEEYSESGKILSIKQTHGLILADLRIGANVASAVALEANERISSNGMMVNGSGFILSEEEAQAFGKGVSPAVDEVIKAYRNGKDIAQKSRDALIIDLFGMKPLGVQTAFPEIYQHVVDEVKPARDVNRRKSIREKWWLFAEPRKTLRKALVGLDRYIATPETSKHRYFVFLDISITPDHMLVAIAIEDAYHLGVLSSIIHTAWADVAGARLGVGNDLRYSKSKCFSPFPFPTPTEAQRQTIRDLAERLDAHRKRQQAVHPKLTMTGMYNVLERERSGEVLSDKERKIHQRGLVSILRQLHDELDAAVAAAYGWPTDLAEQEILQRLVDLNAERAAEEARGLVRWLRPAYQAPDELVGKQSALELVDEDAPAPVVLAEKRTWPTDKPGQVTVLREVLGAAGGPVGEAALADAFKPKLSKKRLGVAVGLLEVLGGLGLVGWSGGGWVQKILELKLAETSK
ncbi:class I SAM-dependent DNA methyltransferase [Neolewinella sp.]|uniref:class I SAM-dependent DNA methyltransferase n=1 Tax=Neolewinella sp. TaxID=2993543 RepID=UPI003B5243CF